MTEYRQTMYETPFDPRVPGGSIGNTMSDPFTNQRPQLLDDDEAQTPIPGFAEIDPKWLTYNPGGSLLVAAVDTRLRIAKLTVDGSKRAAGVYQQIPLPAIGETKEYAFYARVTCGEAIPEEGSGTAIGVCTFGLAVANDMQGDPLGTGFIVAGGYFTRQALDDPPASISNQAASIQLLGYDGLAQQLGGFPFGAMPQWVRWRVKQQQTSADNYVVDLACDHSVNGFDWLTSAVIPQSEGDPMKSIGFIVQSVDGARLSMFVQSFTAAEQAFDDLSSAPTVGNQQQFGAV